MKIASEETRRIVVEAYSSGVASRKQLAEIFGYHRGTIGRWIRESRKTGLLAPRPRGHRPSGFNAEEREQLAEFIEKNPDATLDEIRSHFQKHCPLAAIHKIVRKPGYVFKKTLKASEQEREDIGKSREQWRMFQMETDAKHLVFLDESGAKTNMTLLYGRSYQGTRCHDTAPV